MKSHALFSRWALVIAFALLLLPSTHALAASGQDGPSFELDRGIRLARVSSDVNPVPPGEIGTIDGDPDDVGGGEGKDDDKNKPNPDWERLKESGTTDSGGVVEQIWLRVLASTLGLLRL